ncbi:hypothetical protein [Microbacterium candidum]|uniref:Secreted protein n=1 Tax=Microbacterium candidum TaxID=3041922 RepID=A0ABT7N4B0_9MICO|nr:hypothetical protein [Microbacterium sp. ASV49]MDL9981547.1 hypothetical protein [Microbacterium sp. ASV49]
MRSRTLALFAASAAVLLSIPIGGSMAFADTGGTGHTVTQTTHQHGTWTETGDQDFCTNATVNPTIDGNEVMHFTYFPYPADEMWGTFTETGQVTAHFNGLDWSGKINVWWGVNINRQNQNNSSTSSFRLTATDPITGRVYSEIGHQTAHVGWNAVSQQPVVSFDKMTLTCDVP